MSEPKKTTTTKLESELLRQARVVAAFRGIDLYEYLDALLRGPVVTDYTRIVRGPEVKNAKGGKS